MRVILISMPDVVPIIIHEMAIHMPNQGIASVGGNIDEDHDVYLIDLIRKRRKIRRYLVKQIKKIEPDLIGLSAMSWQYDTSVRIARLIKEIAPEVKIVLGGYHATLMSDEIAASPEARYFDFIIRGEGEESFVDLLNRIREGRATDQVDGLVYRDSLVFPATPALWG